MSKTKTRRIRIGNLAYLGTKPYQLLRELDFAAYSELGVTENVRRMHEGELDVALIPASEFAAHGGYVGLDYGLACSERSDSLLLCSKNRLEQLDTIYMYDGAGTSAVLLRLLLREEWKVSPRLVRVGADFDPAHLRDSEGMLVLKDEIPADVAKMPVIEDLVSAWDRLTGKPFVFLIWAVRPGALNLKQHQALQEMLRRCVEASAELIRADAGDFDVTQRSAMKFSTERYSFYLDDNALAGLNSFYDKAASSKLLPQTRYHSASFTLLNRRAIRGVKEEELGEVLGRVVSGGRLSIRDGIRLAERASVADLGLAADSARGRVFPERRVAHVSFIGGKTLHNLSELDASIEKGLKRGAQQILLLPHQSDLFDVHFYERVVHHIRSKFPVSLEGFTVPQLLTLSRNSKVPVSEIVSRLVTAGLKGISGIGGGMLLDKALRRRGQRFSAAEWLDVMRWVHRFGAQSSCCLTLSADDSWEDRFLHLHRLRAIQDENPGFTVFHLDYAPEWNGGGPSVELRMRALMLSRLFLDNIPSIQENDFLPAEVSGVLTLCLGANEVRVDVSDATNRWQETLRTLQSLQSLGMDFAEHSTNAESGEVH